MPRWRRWPPTGGACAGRRRRGRATTPASREPSTPRIAITERRRAALLVTVVSNYGGARRAARPPAEAHRSSRRCATCAVDVVRRHGGLVNQAIGEEIVCLFGVPTAHDDDELRAVRAALELHARVRELAARRDGSAAIRVQSGLHVGPVVARRLNEGPRRYAIVGAPASVAARLAALAAPGRRAHQPGMPAPALALRSHVRRARRSCSKPDARR